MDGNDSVTMVTTAMGSLMATVMDGNDGDAIPTMTMAMAMAMDGATTIEGAMTSAMATDSVMAT